MTPPKKEKTPKTKTQTTLGTIRVNVKDLQAYEKTKSGWKKSSKQFPQLLNVVKLFKSHNRLSTLIDTIDSHFLKGQLSSEGREQGARINILPNGEKLEKAFSLFSPHLMIHDEDSHDHWDVLYQNRGGTWSYIYTITKRQQHRSRKYHKVQEFAKYYPRLLNDVTKALENQKDTMALPMYTLLTTYMRVGNEIYYRTHGHKGLTTITKKDLKIDGNTVSFNYLGKDGVPINISKIFPINYVARLKDLIKHKKSSDFIFEKQGHPINEADFKNAFMKYCGCEFYPHIVRSYYATSQVEKFLTHKKNITPQQRNQLYLSIAQALGHKKFDKKKGEWQQHFTVTVNSYIQPELVQKVEKLVKE